MKTNFYLQAGYVNNNAYARKHKNELKDFKEQKQQGKNIEHRPAQAINFGGSAVSGATKAVKEGGSILKKGFNFLLEYTSKHEASMKAFTALIMAGILKPMAVLNMPGSEEKDKQIVATKNFLNAFIGFALSKTITGNLFDKANDIVKRDLNFMKIKDGKIELKNANSEELLLLAKEELINEHKKGFIKNLFSKNRQEYRPSIDEIKEKSQELLEDFSNNRLKHFKKNMNFLNDLKSDAQVKTGPVKQFFIDHTKNFSDNNILKVKPTKKTIKDGYETFWKNSPDWIMAITKAKISSLLLPGVMAFLFTKKRMEKAQKAKSDNQNQNPLLSNSSFKAQQEQYQKMLNKNSQLSFKGSITSKIASGVENIGNSRFGEKIAKLMASFNNPFGRMADIESIGITAYWIQNTARSKKIEASQKLGLNVHSALVTVVSSLSAFIIDELLNGRIEKSEEKYKDEIRKIVQQLNEPENKKSFNLEKFKTINAGISEVENAVANYNKKNKINIDIDPVKMAIKDSCYAAISDKKNTKSAKEVYDGLMQTATIKKLPENIKNLINENSIDNYLKLLNDTKSIKEFIEKNAKNMPFGNDIVEELSKVNLLDTAKGGEVERAVKSLGKKYGKSLSKFKTLTIFTLVVRFLVPVLMVPFSGKLKKKIIELTGGNPNAPKTQKK